MLTILKAGSAYFAQMFAAGFALGAIRSLLLVPQFGNRTAELLEMPVRQGGSVAQYLAGRDPVSKRLQAGMLALISALISREGRWPAIRTPAGPGS